MGLLVHVLVGPLDLRLLMEPVRLRRLVELVVLLVRLLVEPLVVVLFRQS